MLIVAPFMLRSSLILFPRKYFQKESVLPAIVQQSGFVHLGISQGGLPHNGPFRETPKRFSSCCIYTCGLGEAPLGPLFFQPWLTNRVSVRQDVCGFIPDCFIKLCWFSGKKQHLGPLSFKLMCADRESCYVLSSLFPRAERYTVSSDLALTTTKKKRLIGLFLLSKRWRRAARAAAEMPASIFGVPSQSVSPQRLSPFLMHRMKNSTYFFFCLSPGSSFFFKGMTHVLTFYFPLVRSPSPDEAAGTLESFRCPRNIPSRSPTLNCFFKF